MALRWSLPALLLMLCTGPAMAWEVEEMLFRASFDGSAEPQVALGNPQPQLDGEVEYTDGKRGQAVVVGEKGTISYQSAGNLEAQAGSIAMWVKPLNWKWDDDKFHIFFDSHGEGRLMLYKFYDAAMGVLCKVADEYGNANRAEAPTTGRASDQWCHFVGTWMKNEQRIYVDGELISVNSNQQQLPRKFADFFSIGRRKPAFNIPEAPADSTAIDELMIFSRPLTRREAAALYEMANGQHAHIPGLHLEVKTLLLPGLERLEVDVAPGFPVKRTMGAKLDLFGPEGGKPLRRRPLQREGHKWEPIQFDLGSFPPGAYAVRATVTKYGTIMAQETETFDKHPPPEWLGNTIGKTSGVPPPWEPVSVNGNTARCFGRVHDFGSGVLPEQISSGGEKLLTDPVALTLTSEGQTIPVNWRNGTWAQVKGEYAVRTAQGIAPHLTVRAKVRLEFDGFMRFDMLLTPTRKTAIQRLDLQIPFHHQRARYIHASRGSSAHVYSRQLSSDNGILWEEDFYHFVWLGDEDRGLCWFAENTDNWTRSPDRPQLQLTRDEHGSVLRIYFINEHSIRSKPFSLTFGIQATPVKPLPERWREIRAASHLDEHVPGPQTYYQMRGYDELKTNHAGCGDAAGLNDDGKAKDRIKALRDRGLKITACMSPTGATGSEPDYATFAAEWALTKGWWGLIPAKGGRPGLTPACPYSSNADYLVWQVDRAIREYDLDGLYYDNANAYFCDNRFHGCGHLDGLGNWHGRNVLFGLRELQKRVYRTFIAHGKVPYIMVHDSANLIIPCHSFATSLLDGEQFRSYMRAHPDSWDLSEILPLDKLRAEFMGRQFGLVPFFVPAFNEQDRKTREPTEHMLSLMLLHDINVRALRCNAEVVKEVWAAQDRFDIAAAEFVPYWENGDYIAGQSDQLKVSYYQHADKVLLVISNLAKEPVESQLTMNWVKLGLKGDKHQAKDAITGENIGIEQKQLTVPIKPQSFRLVEVY
jgi:hypothetical protein